MTPLEQRYRRVLRLLPASYRQIREDDMVAAFLQRTMPEDAEDAAFTAEHGWPGGAEVAGVAALGIRLRLGSAGASPRYVAWGAALRRVALVGLLFHSVLGLFNVATTVWFTRFPSGTARPRRPVGAGEWLVGDVDRRGVALGGGVCGAGLRIPARRVATRGGGAGFLGGVLRLPGGGVWRGILAC